METGGTARTGSPWAAIAGFPAGCPFIKLQVATLLEDILVPGSANLHVLLGVQPGWCRAEGVVVQLGQEPVVFDVLAMVLLYK